MGIKFIACYVKFFGKYAVLVGIQIYNLFEGLDDLAERLCKPLNQLSDVLLGAGLCGRSRRLPSSPRRRGCLWHFHPIKTNSGDSAGGRLLALSICWIRIQLVVDGVHAADRLPVNSGIHLALLRRGVRWRGWLDLHGGVLRATTTWHTVRY